MARVPRPRCLRPFAPFLFSGHMPQRQAGRGARSVQTRDAAGMRPEAATGPASARAAGGAGGGGAQAKEEDDEHKRLDLWGLIEWRLSRKEAEKKEEDDTCMKMSASAASSSSSSSTAGSVWYGHHYSRDSGGLHVGAHRIPNGRVEASAVNLENRGAADAISVLRKIDVDPSDSSQTGANATGGRGGRGQQGDRGGGGRTRTRIATTAKRQQRLSPKAY
eukprot:GHVT01068551.1.p1 GENE.GHVT01068551.1~~GHVT01068551.1.p1  ORF type:complete len:220 (-),score=52.67 GHVT01068551.1:205-864(-)